MAGGARLRQREESVRSWPKFPASGPRQSPKECGTCGARVVHGRTTGGQDIVLDARADGTPAARRGGAFVEVATTPDVTGRRALLVMPSAANGQLHRHRCHEPR